jgi:hypothetical protein
MAKSSKKQTGLNFKSELVVFTCGTLKRNRDEGKEKSANPEVSPDADASKQPSVS